MTSRTESVVKYVCLDLVGSIFRFPVWWYSDGLGDAVDWAKLGIVARWRGYAVGIWLRNLFVPMYGANDWTGRLISVFIRLCVIIFRVFAIVAECVIYTMFVFIWALIPLALLIIICANVYMNAGL